MKQGYVISLSTVPPRFARLGPVLEALLAQEPTPERVLLCIAQEYQRFPGSVDVPSVPPGIEVIRGPDDGPGMKALHAARTVQRRGLQLIYCDDDWLAGPGWARALLASGTATQATTGQGFHITRLGHQGTDTPGCVDIAQGFSGVSVNPEWLADAVPPEDATMRMVDDIWLSAHLAAKGVAVKEVPEARQALRPAFEDAVGLQDVGAGGMDRAGANRACVAHCAERYGIWPKTA